VTESEINMLINLLAAVTLFEMMVSIEMTWWWNWIEGSGNARIQAIIAMVNAAKGGRHGRRVSHHLLCPTR
jgi:hypothetical protein